MSDLELCSLWSTWEWELELLTILDSLLEDLDTLGVWEVYEAVLEDAFETLDESVPL